MSNIKKITAYNKNNKQIMNFGNLVAPFPTLDQIYEISLEDHNGRPYVYRLVDNKSEPAADALNDNIGCEDISVELSDIKEVFIMLTEDQRNIVMHIYYLYKNKNNLNINDLGGESGENEDNPKIILQGPAGAGKSTVINLIEKIITWEENKTSAAPQKLKVLKCAFTGKAASNIEGVTLNHVLSIPIYKTRNLNKKRLDTKKELLENCIFFICDEISMVGERLMASVNMRLQQIFGNDKLYGNRFVLLVGDLYQIDPVRQKPVYPKSELWTCCEFYELNKIIRQQDENFINALNNFRDSQMTQADIDLLKSREIEQIDGVPDSVIHLFFKNNHVDEYNIVKLNKSDEKEETVNTIEDDDWIPYNLRVKIGIRYMITRNMDVGDGLANGTTGIVRGFDYDRNGSVIVIWMEFHSNAIGKRTRSDYFKKHSKPGFEEWVPIYRSNIVVKLKTDVKVSRTVGNMFPLRAAEAVTVHKSQGQTYHEGVCIHLTNDPYDKLRTDKSLQYVALTRVKRLEDLYIMGSFNFSLVNSNKFKRTETELNRLRTERKLELAFETFEDKPRDVIICLNTAQTFNEHNQFITTDKWYGNGSLLIFTETNTIASDEIDIPNFEIAFRSDEEIASRSGRGIICYKEPSKSVDVISSISDDENQIHLVLLKYENYLYIIAGMKGKLSDDDFELAIQQLIAEYVQEERCIFFIGDFSIDANTSSMAEFFNGFNLKKMMPCNIESAPDVLFTRNFDIQQSNLGFYEYIPSWHKPIYVKLPPNPEMVNSQSGTKFVENENSNNFQQFGVQETMEVE